MFNGVVGLVEGDCAGSEFLWISWQSQDGIGENIVEGLSYVELKDLLHFFGGIGADVINLLVLFEMFKLFLHIFVSEFDHVGKFFQVGFPFLPFG